MSTFYIVVTILIAIAGYFYMKLSQQAAAGVTVRPAPSPRSMANGNAGLNGTGKTGGAAASGPQVLALFGSQTGTAEMFAKTLAREGAKLGVNIKLADTDEYDAYNLEEEKLVILVCATYGEGEPTDTMKTFHDYVMDDSRSPGEELKGLKYAVFGLGDRQYKYFCEEAIVMDRRFDELGAERIFGMHCGDCGSGQLEEEFDEWRRDLWPAVGRALNIKLKENTEEPVEPECRLRYWDEPEAPLPFPRTASVLEPTQRLPVWVPLTQNEELLHASVTDRSTRAIAFSLEGTIISYQAGDHLGILPRNTDALVNDYLKILGVSEEDAARTFSLQDIKTMKNVFPARVSARTALKWYIDLAGPPKKSTLRAFAHCCTDEAQKAEMLRLLRVDADAQKDFQKLCTKLRTTYGFLRKFDSARVPLAFFLELMPRIAPRYFSISSDQLDTAKSVGATVSIVEGGLCTTMLSELKVGDQVPVFVRKSNFHLPLRAKERPVVMVGPGTGVAPYIGFIKRRQAWKSKGAALGEAILFFGCRRPEEDDIYSELFAEALEGGLLSDVDIAYSRAQEEKVYVQHRIHSKAADVWRILSKEGGNCYICGDARRMAKDVEATLRAIAVSEGGLSEDEAKAFLSKMEDEERFLKDVWTSTV